MLLGRHLFVGVMQFYILPIRACVEKKNLWLSRKNKEMPSYKADHQHLFVF